VLSFSLGEEKFALFTSSAQSVVFVCLFFCLKGLTGAFLILLLKYGDSFFVLKYIPGLFELY